MLISHEIKNRLSFTALGLLGNGHFDRLSVTPSVQCRLVPLYGVGVRMGDCLSNSFITKAKWQCTELGIWENTIFLPNTSLQTVYRWTSTKSAS